jgi:hypothetical protein
VDEEVGREAQQVATKRRLHVSPKLLASNALQCQPTDGVVLRRSHLRVHLRTALVCAAAWATCHCVRATDMSSRPATALVPDAAILEQLIDMGLGTTECSACVLLS